MREDYTLEAKGVGTLLDKSSYSNHCNQTGKSGSEWQE
jgi:hypothetical protein